MTNEGKMRFDHGELRTSGLDAFGREIIPKADEPKTKPDPPPERFVNVRVPGAMMDHVNALVGAGMFGSNPAEVMERLAAEELKRLMKEGFLR